MIVDLHTHHLPGIDDGSQSTTETIKLLETQKKSGVTASVLTPHFKLRNDNDLIDFIQKRNYIYDTLKKNHMPIQVKIGAEVYYSTDLDLLDLSQLCIEETNYILIEFSTRMKPNNYQNVLYDVISSGYRPIIAHIERYPFFRENLQMMVELVEMGILFQINAETFLNDKEKSFVKACIKHNLVHLVASDSHNLTSRRPNLSDAYQKICDDYGQSAKEEFIKNALAVYNNENISVRNPSVIKRIFGKYL